MSDSTLAVGVSCWMTCSIGMLVFNKLAITVFPVECTLVALQMLVSALVMIMFCWKSLHIGSMKDMLRWCMVAPFFSGMLLTSILALKHSSMSLVITFRAISPVIALLVERFYPNPLRISLGVAGSIIMMIAGMLIYSYNMDHSEMHGLFWVFANAGFAIGDRLLQRLMLASDQHPVDISKTGVTLLNNVLGMIPLIVVACLTGELSEVPVATSELTRLGAFWVVASCAVGVGISYSGVWVQSLISATSFLVLVNANKFVIIFLEVYVMHTKSIAFTQVIGAIVTILAGIMYGRARQQIEAEVVAEKKPLLESKA